MTINFPKFHSLSFCLILLLFSPAPAQPDFFSPKTDASDQALLSDTNYKIIPDTMREVILTALSFYPELENTHIEFAFRDHINKSVMQAQPKISTFFKRKSKRKYIVKISRYLELNEGKVDITTLPCDVLVGWIGHELGHIVDYKDRGTLAMIGFGMQYLFFDSYIVAAERRADLYALEHGLGDNIVTTKQFVLNNVDIPDVYKARIRRLYLSPEDFMLLLSEVAP